MTIDNEQTPQFLGIGLCISVVDCHANRETKSVWYYAYSLLGVVVGDPLEVPLTGGGFVAFVVYVAPASNFARAARCSGVSTATNAASGSVTSDCAPRPLSECAERS